MEIKLGANDSYDPKTGSFMVAIPGQELATCNSHVASLKAQLDSARLNYVVTIQCVPTPFPSDATTATIKVL